MINKKGISKFTALFFVIIIITDFYYKYLLYNSSETIKLLLVTKFLIGTFLVTIIIYFKQLDRKNYFYLSLLFICSIIGLLIQGGSTMYESIYLFSKYAFGIITMLFFFKCYERLNTSYIKKVVLALVLLNFACIVVGFIFSIHVFETYYGNRFGYNGIFKSTSTASYFYMFALVFYLLNKHKTIITYTLISIIVFSSFFVGSKTLIAFIGITAIITLGHFIALKQNLINKRLFYVLYALIIPILAWYVLKTYIVLNSTLSEVLTKDGMLSAIFSYRDILFIDSMQSVQEHFGFLNYIFGGGSHINNFPQMALADLFLSFGIIGMVVYLRLVIYNFPKINNKQATVAFLVIAMSIVLRGNFLYYPSDIYMALAIFAVTLQDIDKYTNNQKT